MLQSKRIANEKSRQIQSFEQKRNQTRRTKKRNRDKLNNSQILREHKEKTG